MMEILNNHIFDFLGRESPAGVKRNSVSERQRNNNSTGLRDFQCVED